MASSSTWPHGSPWQSRGLHSIQQERKRGQWLLKTFMLLRVFPRSWKHYWHTFNWSEWSYTTTFLQSDSIFLCLLDTVLSSLPLPFRVSSQGNAGVPFFASGGNSKSQESLLTWGPAHWHPLPGHLEKLRPSSSHCTFYNTVLDLIRGYLPLPH